MKDLRAAVAALRSIGKTVRQLSRVPSQAARGACPTIYDLLQKEFDEGTDPYGNAWEDLSESTLDKGRSPPPLTDTSAGRTATVTPTSGAGISITLGEPYMAFHQVGTRKMPARPPLPSRGLPESWKRAIEASVAEAFK